MRADSSGPSPAIGSSSSSMRGLPASAIASSSCRCSPWLKAAAGRSSRAPRPTRASAARAGSRNSVSRRASRQKRNEWPACACTASATLSSTLKIEKQRRDLERARQPERAARVHRQRGDVVAGEVDAAGVRTQLAGQLRDQRGLAGAVRADHRVQLARRHVESRGRRWRRCRRSAWPGPRSAAAAQP